MTITCARAEQIAFSTVYFEASQRLLVPKDSPVQGPADLAGKRVCAQVDTTSLATVARVAPTATLARRSELGRLPGRACSRVRRTPPAPTTRSWPEWPCRIPICTSSDRVWRPNRTVSASTRHRTIWYARSMPAWNGSDATGRGCRCIGSGSPCSARRRVHQNRSIGIDMARDEGTRAVLVTESGPVKVEPTRPRLRTGRRRIGDGLVEIPIREDIEPASAILTNPVLAESKRDCSSCGRPVGRGVAGRPGASEGVCPHCGTLFSFSPQLETGELGGGPVRGPGLHRPRRRRLDLSGDRPQRERPVGGAQGSAPAGRTAGAGDRRRRTSIPRHGKPSRHRQDLQLRRTPGFRRPPGRLHRDGIHRRHHAAGHPGEAASRKRRKANPSR